MQLRIGKALWSCCLMECSKKVFDTPPHWKRLVWNRLSLCLLVQAHLNGATFQMAPLLVLSDRKEYQCVAGGSMGGCYHKSNNHSSLPSKMHRDIWQAASSQVHRNLNHSFFHQWRLKGYHDPSIPGFLWFGDCSSYGTASSAAALESCTPLLLSNKFSKNNRECSGR